ncbi:MAG: glycerophosphodiester phosphodiesterase family protein, partial [Bacteroidota bacterium]
MMIYLDPFRRLTIQRFVMLLMLVHAFGIVGAQPIDIRSKLKNQDPKVLVVAHRADPIRFPENSLAGIEFCIKHGVDIIEVDVQKTKDGKLILMHDATVNRTTNGKGRVSHLTWGQISKLRLLDNQRKATEQRVPLLEDVLRMAKGKIIVNIDKAGSNMPLIRKMVDSLRCGPYVILKGTISSRDYHSIDNDRESRPLFMPIITEKTKGVDTFMMETKSPLIEIIVRHDSTYLTSAEGLKMFRENGVQLWFNALFDNVAAGRSERKGAYESWDYFIGLGARIIQTDFPIELMYYLAKKGLRSDIDTMQFAQLVKDVPQKKNETRLHVASGKNATQTKKKALVVPRIHIIRTGGSLYLIS